MNVDIQSEFTTISAGGQISTLNDHVDPQRNTHALGFGAWCPRCEGRGKWYNQSMTKWNKCNVCKGTGRG